MALSLNEKDIINFIQKNVNSFLVSLIRRYRIIKEADLQYQLYFFLERFIEKYNDKRWTLYNVYYLKKTKQYPDLFLMLDRIPIIFIELKYYGFFPPNISNIKTDLRKIIRYVVDYPKVKYTLSINLFSLENNQTEQLNISMRDSTTDERVKFLNINLIQELQDFDKIKSKYIEEQELINHILMEMTKTKI